MIIAVGIVMLLGLSVAVIKYYCRKNAYLSCASLHLIKKHELNELEGSAVNRIDMILTFVK